MFILQLARSKNKILTTGGFTLVEMMVSISIIVLITGLALVRYSAFNSAVLLKSQALEMALDIRQAQAYGVSVSVQTGNARRAYGMAWDDSSNTYQLFQDTVTENGALDNGEAIGQTYTIDPRFEISDITAVGSNCSGDIAKAAVTFKRPNFDAIIWTAGGCTSESSLTVVLRSVEDSSVSRTINVYASGQITVE